jgi:hypothetical protein
MAPDTRGQNVTEANRNETKRAELDELSIARHGRSTYIRRRLRGLASRGHLRQARRPQSSMVPHFQFALSRGTGSFDRVHIRILGPRAFKVESLLRHLRPKPRARRRARRSKTSAATVAACADLFFLKAERINAPILRKVWRHIVAQHIPNTALESRTSTDAQRLREADLW